MWTSQTMTLMEALTVSAMGLTVVISVLALLAVMITAFSKAFALVSGRRAAPAAPPPPQGPREEEIGAVILSVICEEMRADPQDIRIRTIRTL